MMLLILVMRFYQTVIIYKPCPKLVTVFGDNIVLLVWLFEQFD